MVSEAAQPAHTHGVALLNVVAVEGELLLELEIPAVNVVGFEHRPVQAEERAAIEKATRTFSNPELLFSPTPNAQCKLQAVQVDFDGDHDGHAPGDKRGHEAEVDAEHVPAPNHLEFHASYSYRCNSPDELKAIKLGVFEHLNDVQTLQAHVVTASYQTRLSLSADANVLPLQQ